MKLQGTLERELWKSVYVSFIRKEKFGSCHYTNTTYACESADKAVEQFRERLG